MRRIGVFVLVVCALAAAVQGRSKTAEPSPSAEPLDLTQVALFKNGFGFFVGQAALPAGEDGLRFLLPAVPVQGTFWLSYPADVNVTAVVARKVQSRGGQREAITIPEILRANVGRRVRITIDEQQISGRITHFTQDRRFPRILPYAPGAPEAGMERPEIWPPYELGLVLIQTSSGTLSLNPQSIEHVTFLEGDVRRHFARTRDTVEVHVQAAPRQQQNITVSFLAKGITWTPSYLVEIGGQGKARLSAKALIVNEVHDLNDVAVQLATGFPQFPFADVRSPIGMKEPLAQFLASLAGGEQDTSAIRPRAFAMAESARMGYGGGLDLAPTYGAAQEGLTAEDLFLYPAGRITLAEEQVAYIPLFTEAVPYADLYEWRIPNVAETSGRFPFQAQPPEGEKEQEVWHSIRLENTTKAPWTPAPAEAVRDNMIVGQARMPYTPAGNDATLRISRAADITAEQREFEIERKRGAKQIGETYYDLVTVRGELTLTSYREQAVTVEVVTTLSGEVVSTDPQAEIEKLAAGIRQIDGQRKLTWTIEVGPGQTREMTYTYEVHVRGERAPATMRSLPRGVPEPDAP